jgi:hypothetical protein
VSLVLHGHAHRGQLQGATTSGVPVYNVSMPLLTRSFSDRPPFRIFEMPAVETTAEHPAATSLPTLTHVDPVRDVTPQLVRGERRAGERRG